MTRTNSKPQNISRANAPGEKQASSDRRGQSLPAHASRHPTVSGRWLLAALGLALLAAVFCAWCALCLLFWQGSWQFVYHPASQVAQTPASAGVAFDPVEFAATDAGVARLKGWWIPAESAGPFSRFTVLFLHGQDGNLGDTVDALTRLHAAGVNVLAFDYRGYGQSQFVRPSEARWRQDADWALQYLTETRHINPGAIVLDGTGLGANLALEVAARHPSLAGVIVGAPVEAPMSAVFSDARARLVPARLLVRDRYDLDAPAEDLRIPLLWFQPSVRSGQGDSTPEAFQRVAARKMLVWLNPSDDAGKQYQRTLTRWLDSLEVR